MNWRCCENYLIVGALLFGIGLVGFFSRRNMIVMFLSAEMMLQGVSVSLVAWGRYHNDWGGQMLVIFILTVAACEAAIALAVVLTLVSQERLARHRHLAAAARREPAAVRRIADVAAHRPKPERSVAQADARRHRARAGPGRNHAPHARVDARNDSRSNACESISAYDRRHSNSADPDSGAAAGRRRSSRPCSAAACCKHNSHLPVVVALVGSFVASLVLLVASAAAVAKPSGSMVGWETTVDLWNWVTIADAIDTPAAAHAAGASGAARLLPATLPFTHRRHAAGRRADGDHAVDGHVRLVAGGHLRQRLHARRPRLLAVLQLHRAVRVFDDDAGLGEQLRAAVRVLGSGRLCSYLLIGFWYEKPAAAAAGKKAFLVNRVGDFGFALGLFLIWTTYGTLNFHDAGGVAGVLGQTRLAQSRTVRRRRRGHGDLPAADAGGLRQERPVSAARVAARRDGRPHARQRADPRGHDGHGRRVHGDALHAAVHGVARRPDASWPSIGCVTAAIGGVIALTQTDLKRVLAYSTISQLGYMFLGLGVATLAGITAGMFHLFTHAFFKALLFLGAGSVMHAMGGVIDMRRFGGLRRLMPITHWTFLFGCLALAGVFPFAGFWSKDAILAAVLREGPRTRPLYRLRSIGSRLVTAFLTAIYTFRAFFLTFYGHERMPHEAGHHAHESPPSMTVPLVILAVCALVVGAYFEWTGGFADFWPHTPSLAYQRSAPAHGEHAGGSHTAGGRGLDRRGPGRHRAGRVPVPGRSRAGVGAAAAADAACTGCRTASCSSIRSINVLVVWPLRMLGAAELLVRSHGDRRPGESRRPAAARPWPRACVRCRPAWCSFTPWPWCGASGAGDHAVDLAGLGRALEIIAGGIALDWMPTLLLATIFMPLAGALLVLLAPASGQVAVRQSALVTSLVTLVMTAMLVGQLRRRAASRMPRRACPGWRDPSGIDIQFAVALDGLSLWLFGLSSLLLFTSCW